MSYLTELRTESQRQHELSQTLRAQLLTAIAQAHALADQDNIEAHILWAHVEGLTLAATRAAQNVIEIDNEISDLKDPDGLRAEAGL